MPGPSNKKKRKPSHKNQKGTKTTPKPTLSSKNKSDGTRKNNWQCEDASSPSSSRSPSQQLLMPLPVAPTYLGTREHEPEEPKSCQSPYSHSYAYDKDDDQQSNYSATEGCLPPTPYIYDPGNGPRVRDTRAFLSSKYFAQKPAMDIPLCAEFAQLEILEMLRTVLPEETARILWYNKSRATSRICPACQRLYRLGDKLPDLMSEGPHKAPAQYDTPYLRSEQEISGLCSPVCFILASYNHPGAIKQAWGRMVDEIDDEAWEIMNGPGQGNATGELSRALSMLVKMTRLHDLGLSQLCFGQEDSADELGDALIEEGGTVEISSEFLGLTIAS